MKVVRTPRVGEFIINNRNETYMRLCLDVKENEVSVLLMTDWESSLIDVPAAKHVIEASIEMEEWV